MTMAVLCLPDTDAAWELAHALSMDFLVQPNTSLPVIQHEEKTSKTASAERESMIQYPVISGFRLSDNVESKVRVASCQWRCSGGRIISKPVIRESGIDYHISIARSLTRIPILYGVVV